MMGKMHREQDRQDTTLLYRMEDEVKAMFGDDPTDDAPEGYTIGYEEALNRVLQLIDRMKGSSI